MAAKQIGLEPTFEEFLAKLVTVFDEVRRVLQTDGTCWVNMGDSYASGGGTGHQGKHGATVAIAPTPKKPSRQCVEGLRLKSKDLLGQPWQLAFAAAGLRLVSAAGHHLAQAQPHA